GSDREPLIAIGLAVHLPKLAHLRLVTVGYAVLAQQPRQHIGGRDLHAAVLSLRFSRARATAKRGWGRVKGPAGHRVALPALVRRRRRRVLGSGRRKIQQ